MIKGLFHQGNMLLNFMLLKTELQNVSVKDKEKETDKLTVEVRGCNKS
jgi:hypothetical protein